MTRTCSCPKCGRDVTPKDITVAKDIMLCPSCGEVSSFSAIVERGREREEDDAGRRLLSAPPPKHLTVETDPTDMTGRIVLVYRKFSKGAFFLVSFTCVCADMSEDALDYVEAIVRREISRA